MTDAELKAYIERQQREIHDISMAIMGATQTMGSPDSLMLALLGLSAKIAADFGISRDNFLKTTGTTLAQLYDQALDTPPMIKMEHKQ
jgi:hypothetical protein